MRRSDFLHRLQPFQRAAWLLPALLGAALLSACATLAGPREVSVPVEKLQAALGARFPFRQRYLELLDITATNPRLTLQPDSNRVLATIDATIAPLLMRRSFTGSFTLSGRLAIDPARHAVVLQAPRMENLTLDGVDDRLTGQLARIGGALAEGAVGDVPLYVFDPEKFRYAGTQYIPTRIVTTARSLVVTFEPVK